MNVICIDARPSKGRPTGLRQNARYVVYSEDEAAICCYCYEECSRLNVGYGRTWCAKRFAQAPTGKDIWLPEAVETPLELVGD